VILVDDLKHYPHTHLREKRWCHMVSDSNETELHQFAAQLGLRREWFQSRGTGMDLEHYDLTPRRRKSAIAAGAVEVSSREIVRRHYNRKHGDPKMIPEPLAKSQAYRETLLHLGFTDAQIKLGFGTEIIGQPTPPAMQMLTIGLYVTAVPPAAADFLIVCGAIWKTWTPEICMLNWNKVPREARQANFQKHQPLTEIARLVAALQGKGIAIPDEKAAGLGKIGQLL